jgi:hypothetical protein
MQTGPKVKLAIDLQKIDRYFPLDFNAEGGFDYNLIIDRHLYDEVSALLHAYKISDDHLVREICFIRLWIEKEIQVGDDRANYRGKFNQMWVELDNLKDYLMKNRITSISFRGEYERNEPGEELILKEEINIDRVCDGIRSIFRDEFHHDKQKRRTKGLTSWQRRKMIRIRNNFLNYFESVPGLDALSLEDQNELIGQISNMGNLPE